jgi:YVTN family beta-propeller protein
LIELRLLGSLEVLVDGRSAPLARGHERALLALLAINAGRPVAVDRLIDELWGGEPPDHAAKSVQIYVSRLRKSLGSEHIATTSAGYLLRLDPGALDRARFESLASEGKGALERADFATAKRTLTEALALWRGDVLDDFRFASFAQEEIRRLEELRNVAEADLIDAQLALGETERAVPRLRSLIDAQPLWERPRAQLMLALYRSGRQAEALELYRSTRSDFDREVGLEPSADLTELHRRILNNDPDLGATPRSVRLAVQRRRAAPLVLVGGALIVAAAVAAAFLFAREGEDRALAAIAPNSLGAIDPQSDRLVMQVGGGSSPTAVGVGHSGVWVADGARQELARIDPRNGKISRRIPLAAIPTQLAVGRDAVWVTSPLDIDAGILTRVDVRTGVGTRVPVRTEYVADLFAPATPNVLALDGHAVWTNTVHGRLVRVADGRRDRFDLGQGHSVDGIAVGGGSIWIASSVDDTVLRFDGRRGKLAAPPIRVNTVRRDRAAGPAAVAYGYGAVWVANALADTVTRIDPRTNALAATIRVGSRPTAVAIGEGGIWVLDSGDGTVSHVDPDTNRVVATIPVGRSVSGIAAGAGRVWVTVAGGRAPRTAPPVGPARPLVTGSCGPLESGDVSPDLLIASDFPSFDNEGRMNPPIRDIRRAIVAVLRQRGFRAGPYRVGLQHCTDSSPGQSPDLALSAANARAFAGNPSVVGVIGTYQSAAAMVELPILGAAPSGPVALISPSNTHIGLTHEGPQTAPFEPDRYYPIGVRNYVRLAPPDDAQGAGLALLAKQLDRKRLYLLDDGDPTAVAMAEYVDRAASRLGLSVVGRAHWNESGPYTALAQSLRAARPTAVVLTGCICSNGGEVLVTLRRTLGRGVAVLASDNFTFSGDMAGRNAPPEAFGVYISGTGADPSAVSEFPPGTAEFLKRVFPGRPLNDIERYVPLAAAATQALLDAIRRSDGSRASIVEELTRGRAAGTLVGTVSFDANGDLTHAPVSIYRISKAAGPTPHLPVSGLKLDRVIEADPALAAP